MLLIALLEQNLHHPFLMPFFKVITLTSLSSTGCNRNVHWLDSGLNPPTRDLDDAWNLGPGSGSGSDTGTTGARDQGLGLGPEPEPGLALRVRLRRPAQSLSR